MIREDTHASSRAPRLIPFADDVPLPTIQLNLRDRASRDVVFGGDTSLGDNYLARRRWAHVHNRLRERPLNFFEGVQPLIKDRAALVLNLETVLAANPPDIFSGQKKYLGWDNPDRTTSTLSQLSADAVTLANNHTMDFGDEMALLSITLLQKANIQVAGLGKNLAEAATPLSLDFGETEILIFPAFEHRRRYAREFNFFADMARPGVAGFGRNATLDLPGTIARYRDDHPEALIIVQPHWGGARNYQWATDAMFGKADTLMRAGADIVMGHGAHMLQEVEKLAAGTLVASLGNFVYNSPGRYKKMEGFPYSLVARLSVATGSASLRLYPIHCDNRLTDFHTRPVTADQANEVYAELANRARNTSHFRSAFSLTEDDRGWHLRNREPLSPRLSSE